MKTGFTGKRYFEWLGKHSGYSFMPRLGKYYLWPEYARKAFAMGSMQKNRSKQCQQSATNSARPKAGSSSGVRHATLAISQTWKERLAV